MKRKILMLILVLVLIFTSTGYGETVLNYVQALTNYINVELNGEPVQGINLLYEGTTYVPLKIMAEMVGGQVSWDGETKTASVIISNQTSQEGLKPSELDLIQIDIDGFYKPIISYSDLGIQKSEIFGIMFKASGTEIQYALEEDGLHWNQMLEFGAIQDIIITKNDGTNHSRRLIANQLVNATETSDAKIILVPPMPELGFNFPYIIRTPGKTNTNADYSNTHYGTYTTNKQYMVVDSSNSGVSDIDGARKSVLKNILEAPQLAVTVARDFGYPVMYPILPRTNIAVLSDYDDFGAVYEHALDRDSVMIKELMTTDSNHIRNKNNYADQGIDPELFYDFDLQLKNMFEHAVDYLNDYDYKLEKEIIMVGYSATGSFVERFMNLYPENVAMVFAGGNNDDLMFPASEYKGKTLNYPLGTADFKSITGNEFNKELVASIPKIYYMGKDDTNNVVGYLDCYGVTMNDLYKELFSEVVLTRAKETEKAFNELGGSGMFILDQGVGHGWSNEAGQYLYEFIKANADSDVATYPIPTANRLEYTIFD